MEIKLIGLAGKAGTGKTTLARYLTNKYWYTRMAFADPIKRSLCALFDLSIEYFTDSKLKEEPVPWLGLSPRALMQSYNDYMKDFYGEDIYVTLIERRIAREYAPRVVIDDVRFDNEAHFIREKGGVIVHLSRENIQTTKHSDHVSEKGVTFVEGDLKLQLSEDKEKSGTDLVKLLEAWESEKILKGIR